MLLTTDVSVLLYDELLRRPRCVSALKNSSRRALRVVRGEPNTSTLEAVSHEIVSTRSIDGCQG